MITISMTGCCFRKIQRHKTRNEAMPYFYSFNLYKRQSLLTQVTTIYIPFHLEYSNLIHFLVLNSLNIKLLSPKHMFRHKIQYYQILHIDLSMALFLPFDFYNHRYIQIIFQDNISNHYD